MTGTNENINSKRGYIIMVELVFKTCSKTDDFMVSLTVFGSFHLVQEGLEHQSVVCLEEYQNAYMSSGLL